MTDETIDLGKHYVHYTSDGTIIGSEWTNRPSTIAGATCLEVDEDVGNVPRQWKINTTTLLPERIT